MALNIFHPSTTAGLIQYAENDPTGMATSTASFLTLFNSMWEILNIKTRDKWRHKKIPFAKPFYHNLVASDLRFEKITQFINWLTEWERFNSNGVLTPETFHALILNSRA